MATRCLILRNNRTLGKKKLKDKCDDFIFEGGTYYIKREKVFLNIIGRIRKKVLPTLLYFEGVSEPIYIDNFKFKEYIEDVPLFDKNNKPIVDDNGTQLTEKKVVKKLEDIFIDSRAIHNMTDKKILDVLSSQPDISFKDIFLFILLFVIIILTIIGLVM